MMYAYNIIRLYNSMSASNLVRLVFLPKKLGCAKKLPTTRVLNRTWKCWSYRFEKDFEKERERA